MQESNKKTASDTLKQYKINNKYLYRRIFLVKLQADILQLS